VFELMPVIGHVSLTPCRKHWQTVTEVYLVSIYTIWIQYGLLKTRVNAATGRSCAAKAQVRFYASPWGICGGQCGKETVCSPVTSFLTCQHNCTAARAGAVSADYLSISTVLCCCKLQSIPRVQLDTWKDCLLSCGKKHGFILFLESRPVQNFFNPYPANVEYRVRS